MRNTILERESKTGWFYAVISNNSIGIFENKSINTIDNIIYIRKYKTFTKAEKFIRKQLNDIDINTYKLDEGHLRPNKIYNKNII